MTVENVQQRYDIELTKRYNDAIETIETRNDAEGRSAFWKMVYGYNEAADILGLPKFEVPLVDERTDHEVVGDYLINRVLAENDERGGELAL